jgi:hypothetical protein
MADEKASGFCKQCNKQSVVFRKGTNHILHLLLTLVTMGLWILVWFGSAVKFGGWRCSTCGSTQLSNVR